MKNVQLSLGLVCISFVLNGMETNKLTVLSNIYQHPYIAELKIKRDNFKKELESEHKFVWGQGYNLTVNKFFTAIYNTDVSDVTDIIEDVLYKMLSNGYTFGGEKASIARYSVLGAATMSHKLSSPEKNKVIQSLFATGFSKLLEGDKELAFLERWERVPFNKMVLVQYAARNNLGIVPELPQELIMLICQRMSDAEESLL